MIALESFFRLEDVYQVKGRGTVYAGTLLKAIDERTILGSQVVFNQTPMVITGIEHYAIRTWNHAGAKVGILMRPQV